MRRFLLTLLLSTTLGHAGDVEYDLEVAAQRWSPDGKLRPVRALTVNGGIPGPTLRFREGDIARIRVHNRLPNEETSIYWHGLFLPNGQEIKFCCMPCVAKFEKNPAKYLAKLP